MARDLGQDAVAGEQRHQDQLAEQARARLLHQGVGGAQLRLLGFRLWGGPNSIASIMPLPRTSLTSSKPDKPPEQPFEQPIAELAARAQELLVLEDRQRRKAGRHREVVLGEGRAVHEGAVHAVEHPIENFAAHRDRADRHEAARERLGEQHQVGQGPKCSQARNGRCGRCRTGSRRRSARRVAAAEARLGEVALGRQVDAVALDRLDDEGRDVLPASARASAR